MFRYFISLCFVFSFINGYSQEEKENDNLDKVSDSIVYKTNYGLRLGADISKPIKGTIDGAYSGFEIVGDYRLKKNFYLAAEAGFEEETSNEDYLNTTSKGSYIRLGFNYNAYKNWLDMNNEIFVGYRYGFSLFEQTLNNYTPNVSDAENGNYFPAELNTNAVTSTGLNAHWSELMLGIKAETFTNFYIGFSVSYKVMMSVKDPDGVKALFSPGFNRIFESNTGFGFNYTLSYLIPFSKK